MFTPISVFCIFYTAGHSSWFDATRSASRPFSDVLCVCAVKMAALFMAFAKRKTIASIFYVTTTMAALSFTVWFICWCKQMSNGINKTIIFFLVAGSICHVRREVLFIRIPNGRLFCSGKYERCSICSRFFFYWWTIYDLKAIAMWCDRETRAHTDTVVLNALCWRR